jgi:hypothetical protein
MILGARRFYEMLDELESALFPSATGMGKLKCLKNAKLRNAGPTIRTICCVDRLNHQSKAAIAYLSSKTANAPLRAQR